MSMLFRGQRHSDRIILRKEEFRGGDSRIPTTLADEHWSSHELNVPNDQQPRNYGYIWIIFWVLLFCTAD